MDDYGSHHPLGPSMSSPTAERPPLVEGRCPRGPPRPHCNNQNDGKADRFRARSPRPFWNRPSAVTEQLCALPPRHGRRQRQYRPTGFTLRVVSRKSVCASRRSVTLRRAPRVGRDVQPHDRCRRRPLGARGVIRVPPFSHNADMTRYRRSIKTKSLLPCPGPTTAPPDAAAGGALSDSTAQPRATHGRQTFTGADRLQFPRADRCSRLRAVVSGSCR